MTERLAVLPGSEPVDDAALDEFAADEERGFGLSGPPKTDLPRGASLRNAQLRIREVHPDAYFWAGWAIEGAIDPLARSQAS